MGGRPYGNGIAYSNSETAVGNSFNENLTVEADEQSLFMRSMGMSSFTDGRRNEKKLSMEGASELYWGLFIDRLQR